eukprot:gnl/MRDRNA2_/MRDRNA2_63855_c0_seq1.p1 gnl/MRDRNA2_/MRDRNA2_63855_c0~~gnl/MRDRNA2_/MRDRNA2_63855_c0_seq1.p1  ORF type:complete len:386 (+),score=108.98 gnl/MRDRNA2_/MRDRNA2_63855_c0_seq1:51-1160(+)
MKVSVKTIGGTSFEVEAANEDKVKELKNKIAAAKPDLGPSANMKVLCAGKILQDEVTIQDSGIKPGGFVVVMTSKKAEGAQAPAPAGAAAVSATTTAPDELGSLGAAVQEMIKMGYDRGQVERCLRAAFRDPERAMQYLMSCLPETTTPAPAATPAPVAQGGETPVLPFGAGANAIRPQASSGGSGANAISSLRGNPEFEQIASQLGQVGNNAEMQQMLTAMAQANPQMFQALQQNPQALMELLNGAGGEGQEGGAAGGAQAGQPGVISVSPQEKEAIDRLVALVGCDESTAAQAYFACDKNEELAANFLFDSRDGGLLLIQARQAQTHFVGSPAVLASACVILFLVGIKRFFGSQKLGQGLQKPFLNA